MGIYDRDWYQKHGRKSAYSLPDAIKDEGTSRLRNRLAHYSKRNFRSEGWQYTVSNVLMWLAMLSLISAFFFWREAPFASISGDTLEIVVPRAPDGHYHIDGQINGKNVRFLIDTGASYISVSTATASKLGLLRDGSATFNTANGQVRGQIASQQSVRVAGLVAPPMSVSIMPGLSGEALLGQNFLRHVTMTQAGQFLVLQGKTYSGPVERFGYRTKWALVAGIGLLLLSIGIRRFG